MNKKIREMCFCGMMVALMAIFSWISIPIGAVPVTLQTFAVFAAVGILGGKLGTISVLVYVIMGAVGIPVFAGFSGGFGVITGPTGGYIVGFILSALIMWMMEKMFGSNILILTVSMIIGLIVCYAFGTVWFMTVYTQNTGAVGLGAVLGWCVIPFIIPDAVKIICAVLITSRVRKPVNSMLVNNTAR